MVLRSRCMASASIGAGTSSVLAAFFGRGEAYVNEGAELISFFLAASSARRLRVLGGPALASISLIRFIKALTSLDLVGLPELCFGSQDKSFCGMK